ncbi:transcription factor AP-4 [Tetranychus urticae]|uniref:BHLH domain-containing protein n=1 Tax=Tetranychus urticae TaxID=32264 RepID=T1L0D7_TETUR|nr:transcription factor AP-4 [Tetranychus urticae]
MSRLSPRSQLEHEKRVRREIANSNERRRMQSINAGFNSLRTMLPKHDGEKLSKAAILQHTAEYIHQLEQEKTRLLSEICQLKRSQNCSGENDGSFQNVAPLKKVKIVNTGIIESDSSDEGIQCQINSRTTTTSGNESEINVDELKNDLVEVRKVLDRERRLRMQLEDQVRALEAQLYPERIKEIAQQVHLQFNSNTEDSHISASEETAAAVSSVVNDEIVAETIEIETHSCPDSPLHQTTFVVTAPTSNPNSSPPSPTGGETPQDLSTKPIKLSSVPMTTTPSKANQKSAQPAAIALPIDVPFVGNETTGPTTVTLRIIGSIGDATARLEAAIPNTTSRQNLDTIVEAIRHLEGDHLFRDDMKLVTAAVTHPM